MTRRINFEKCLSHMEKCNWSLDSAFKVGSKLDFSKNFLPASLTLHNKLTNILSIDQTRILNQITTKSYLNFFYFVEEFIIEQIKLLSVRKSNEKSETSALTHFFQEELKHQKMFKRVMSSIDDGMSAHLRVVDFEKDSAAKIMKFSPLGVMLFIYHIEIVTQIHYLESIRNDNLICDKVAKVLQYHWIEESQHANIDYLEISNMVYKLPKSVIILGVNEYIRCLDGLFEIFAIQANYDVDSLTIKIGKKLSTKESKLLNKTQIATYAMLFIKSGLYNRQLTKFFIELLPEYVYVVEEYKARLC